MSRKYRTNITPYSLAIKGLLLLLLPGLNGGCHRGYSVASPTPPPPARQNFAAWIDSLVLAKMNTHHLPGLAIGIVQDGAVVYTAGYGVKSLADRQPVTDRSVFHTASVSKLFTAQAVIELVREGRLALEDRLSDLAPELRFAGSGVDDITVRQLLNHTAGLPDIRNYHWGRQRQNPERLRNYLRGRRWRVRFAPGTRYGYSNLGYDLLGYLIEKTAGEPFETYVKGRILLPSGMVDSDFRYFAIPDSLRTTPHTRKGRTGKLRLSRTYPYTREHAPSSTLNASVHELASWMLHLLDRVQTEPAYQLLLTPSTPVYPGIGLGFQLGTLAGYATAGHYGGDRGFRSYLLLIPDQQIGLVVLANSDQGEDFRQEVLHPIARQMLTLEQVP